MKYRQNLLNFCLWLAMLAILFVQACSAPPPPLRVGLSPWPPYEFAYLARELGYFAEAGVDVRLLEFDTLADTRRAFEQGYLDGMTVSLSEVLEARDASQRDLRIVRVVDYSAGGDMILATQAVKNLRQLKGKRVAVEPTSLGIYVLVRALEREGLAAGEVQPVVMPPEQMEKALRKGQVQGVVSYAPYATRMLRQPGLHVIYSSKQMQDDILDLYAFDAPIIQQRRPQLEAYFQALDRAFEYYQAKPEAACAIMAKRARLSTSEFCQAMQREAKMIPAEDQLRYLGPQGRVHSLLEQAQRILSDEGRISAQKDLRNCLMPL